MKFKSRSRGVRVHKKQPLTRFKMATMDCEAVTFNSDTKEGGGSENIDMIGFYDGDKYFCFKTGLDFLDFIWVNMDKYNKTYIYAHNFAGYDIYAFLDDLKEEFVDNFSVVEISGKFVEFSLFKNSGGHKMIVTFRDSYKILPSSLEKLGKAFGFPKTVQPPFDHHKYALPIIGGENYYKEMYEQVKQYNKNDCVILYKILKTFFEEIPGEFTSIPLTTPSLAFKVWKKMNNLVLCSDVSDAWKYDKFIRKSYSGGRTEVFKTSVENDEYCYVDINCYSEDTECWTEYGWKRYSELKIGMKVMTYNTKKKKMEMKPIQKIIINHYKGDMHHYTGKNVDCLVTPNHNMIIKQHITFDEEEWVSSQCPINCLFPNREDNSWSPCDKSIVEYEGIVWCITVDNHNFLTMRNNRKAWQGNSIYPSKMEVIDFPAGDGKFYETPEIIEEKFLKETHGFYKVKWIAPDIHIPILWEKKDGKLLFPVNRKNNFKGRGYYAYPELKLAHDNGYQIEFQQAVLFTKTVNMFKEFVDKYKKMKFEGGAKKTVAKLIQNALYGKLGQKTTVRSCVKLSVIDVVNLLEAGFKVEEVDPRLGLYNIEVARMSKDIIVSWASYITAHARCYMWENLQKCNFDVAYMDSVTGDSIIYTNEGMKKVEDMFIEDNLICLNNKEYCQISSKILSYNLQTNSSEYVYPQYLMRHKVNKKGYEIYYKDDNSNKIESLKVTENHSIFTLINSELKTVKGKDIEKLKVIIYVTENGYKSIPVISVKQLLIDDYVYDFETPSHTFCVKNILVHNTDSFIVNKKHVDKLWLDEKIYGAFKREYEVHRGCFFAPKFYIMDVHDNEAKKDKTILKIKGIHDYVTKKIVVEGYDKAKEFIIDHATRGEGVEIISIIQFKMSRKLKSKPRSGSTRKMIKLIKLVYDKREIMPDGVNTRPW